MNDNQWPHVPSPVRQQVLRGEGFYAVAVFALRILPVPFTVFVVVTTLGAIANWSFDDDAGSRALLDVGIISGVLLLGAALTAGLGKYWFMRARRTQRELLGGGASDPPVAGDTPKSGGNLND